MISNSDLGRFEHFMHVVSVIDTDLLVHAATLSDRSHTNRIHFQLTRSSDSSSTVPHVPFRNSRS